MRDEDGGRPGRARLDRRVVLGAALRIVDERGVEGLTMQALGTDLGVAAMSLYRHYRNKTELLDDLVAELIDRAARVPRVGDWRVRLHQLLEAWCSAFASHPALLAHWVTRPTFGPALLRTIDTMLGLLRAGGFGPEEAARCCWCTPRAPPWAGSSQCVAQQAPIELLELNLRLGAVSNGLEHVRELAAPLAQHLTAGPEAFHDQLGALVDRGLGRPNLGSGA